MGDGRFLGLADAIRRHGEEGEVLDAVEAEGAGGEAFDAVGLEVEG